MKNKKLIIMLSVITILVLTLGVSFAVFTYNKESVKNSSLVVGDIYMHYNETNQIKMENATPTNPYIVNPIMSSQEYTEDGTNELSKCVLGYMNVDRWINTFDKSLKICKDSSLLQEDINNGSLDYLDLTDTFINENIIILNSSMPYFEFTIDGKNTTANKDVWYEIVLSKGDDISGKIRIKDNLLKFTLIETKNDETLTVINNKRYDDLTNKRIWVDTIDKNTTNEVIHTYRLYMWISGDTYIGNTEDVDYTMEEWKNIFASIKVNVTGDFEEKYLNPEDYCFETMENDTGLTITDYDKTCGKKIIIPQTINNKNVTKIGERAFWYKNLMNIVIPDSVTIIESNAFTNNQLTNVEISSSVTTIGGGAFANNQLTNVEIPSSVTTIGGGAFANNQLTNIEIPLSVTTIESGTFDNNKISNVNINASITSIGAYAFTNNNIQDLIVPDTVTKLHCKSFDDGVVNNRNMTCQETSASCFTTYTNNDDTITITDYDNTCDKDVIIPEKIDNKKITIIGSYAFENNQLTSVIIPDTVTDINRYAFHNNKLAIIKFPTPSLLKSIGNSSFENNNIVSVIIPDSVTFLHCSAFDYQVIITKPDNLVCEAPLE